ncbi:MAG: 50S ribosomal protein L9 [Planctomycetia bacterium]|nr:50S ribosomal protein L9 [Planctomycetia bacterium]
MRKQKRNPFKRNYLPKGPNGGVQLLLIQRVEHLGKQGDIVEVRPGYANNYLIPQGFATIATEHHKRMVEKHKEKLLEIQKSRMDSLRTLADQLKNISISIEANVNEQGHLYGSVGTTEILNALKKMDITLEEHHIKLAGPMREHGMYLVKIQLSPEIEAELRVWIIPGAGSSFTEK